MNKRKSSTIFFQTKISSLKIEIGCQTWAKSNLRLLECCSWGKLNWNVISGRWTPFKITNIPAAWMVDSYEYSGIKTPPLLTCEPLRTTIGRMPFKEVGTYGFQFKWNDKLDTALYALLVSRNINHIFCWPAQHGIPKEIPFWQCVLRNIFTEDTVCWIANMLSFRIPKMHERGVCFEISFWLFTFLWLLWEIMATKISVRV